MEILFSKNVEVDHPAHLSQNDRKRYLSQVDMCHKTDVSRSMQLYFPYLMNVGMRLSALTNMAVV